MSGRDVSIVARALTTQNPTGDLNNDGVVDLGAPRPITVLDGPGDVDGLAWEVMASVMNFTPDHSIGLNYGRAGAGWLLSPQFRENDELLEIRYQWRPSRLPVLEARVRWREELERLTGALQKREQFDFYLRLTWQFKVKDF